MIRVGLVDDQPFDLEKMVEIISQMEGVTIVFATQSAEEAYRQVKNHEIDLLICDIEMPNLSGFELAHFIHSYALDICVIFVTAHSGYAVHAFELQVHDYIMKPFARERLRTSVQRYIEKKKRKEADREVLIVKQRSEIHFIKKKEIIYIERTGRSSTIVTTTGKYETYQTLSELEASLAARDFFRSHRSFIINIHYIKNFSLYTKHSYLVTFYQTQGTALITKDKMEEFQAKYF